MSSMPQPPRRITREEYLERERTADTRGEFLDGEIVAMAGATREHVRIVSNLIARLDEQLRGRPCDVYPNDLRVSIDSGRSYVYPNIVITCGDEVFDGEQILTNPVVLIEVDSSTMKLHNRSTKFFAYQSIECLREYVLISTEMQLIEVYSRCDPTTWRYDSSPFLSPSIFLPSIECRLTLDEVYSRVDVPVDRPEWPGDEPRRSGEPTPAV